MLHRAVLRITVLFACVGLMQAQTSILTNQVELLDPALSLSVARDFAGTAPSGFGEAFYWEDYSEGDPYLAFGHGTDALGRLYQVTVEPSLALATYEVTRLTDLGPEAILRVQKCVPVTDPGGQTIYQLTILRRMMLDSINGQIYIAMDTRLRSTCYSGDLQVEAGIVRISGLPTLLDIILSYQLPSTLSFNVPARPEGLPGTDSFSVYSGDARTASDLSQAFAMQCTAPAGRTPVAGELVEVADTLPDPAPGESRYYLAAVNYQGQRRAGRQSINGVLQGRNAAALPVCH